MAHMPSTEAIAGAVAHASELNAELPHHEQQGQGEQGGKQGQGDPLAETLQALDRAAREHPWHTVGIAFGVGLLIGLTR